MSDLYLVRHGQGSFGSQNYDKLSELGREQSRLLGSHFAEVGVRIDGLYAGTLERQRETAELLAEGYAASGARLSVICDAAFNEYEGDVILKHYAASLSPAELQAVGFPALMQDRSRFQRFLERAARAWVDGTLAAEALLSFKDFHARITSALKALMAEHGRGKTLVVATSGGVIGTAVAHVLGQISHLGIELNWAVHNASITRLIYSGERVSLSSFNALPHLERPDRLHMITYR